MTTVKEHLDTKASGRENTIENIIAVLIVVAVVVAIVWWARKPPAEPDEEIRVHVPIGASPGIGDPDAPVVVVEFSDFECPFCSQFALGFFPKIKERFIDTGKAYFVYKYFPIQQSHQHAFLAAQAASCAHEQEAFWEYHDLLYANQDALEIGHLLEYADELNLDKERFKLCLVNEENREDVLRDKDAGIQASVTGTPTFFFDGRKVTGVLTPDEFGNELMKEGT